MDRFIGISVRSHSVAMTDLKSNMDRFIVAMSALAKNTITFKIQYGQIYRGGEYKDENGHIHI